MSIFDLQKRQEAVKFVLEKRDIAQAPTMRVGVALDVSGSAQGLYSSGVMQATLDRLIPIAMRFDDNGELDVWAFDTRCTALPSVTKHDYEGYITRNVLQAAIHKWHGTIYAEPMESMIAHYFPGSKTMQSKAASLLGGLFGKKPAPAPVQAASPADKELPAMALFITDGANSDRSAAEAVLRASIGKPIYWQLVGVGDPREFEFLKQMADDLPNAGFVHLSSLNLSDEALYDALLSQELAQFIKKL